MNPLKAATGGGEDGQLAYRLLLVPAAVSLALSATALSSTRFFQEARSFTATPQGTSPLDLLVVGACLVVLLIGFLDRSKVPHSYYLSALLFAPSVLGLSNADWLGALGFKGGFTTFRGGLSELDLLVVGLALIGGYIFHRSAVRQIGIRAELRSLGAPRGEVDTAGDRMLVNSIYLVASAAVITVVMWAAMSVMTDALDPFLGGARGLYVWVGLLAGVLLMVFIAFVLSKARGSETFRKGQ